MGTKEHTIHYIEIVTPDVEPACVLYASAFGLTFRAPDAVLGNARVAEIANGSIFGIRAPLSASEKPVQRLYVRVQDLDAAVASVAEHGARVMLERMELPGHGTIAIYEHGGIEHGLWQPE